MGWERRGRGGLYYTRSRKVDGCVVREYVGGGIRGRLAADEDARERAERAERAAMWRAERDRLDAADRQLTELCRVADVLARAALVRAGYYQHHRGEWRRRRGKAKGATAGQGSG